MRINEIMNKYSFKELPLIFLSKYFGTQIGKIHYLRLNTDIEKTKSMLSNFKLNVKELYYEDFLLGDKTVFKGKKLELVRNRLLDDNYKAYGIIENGKLIYSTWFSTKNLGLPIQTKPIPMLLNEGLLEDSYCDPIARGRGLHSQMNNFRILKLYKLGKTRVLALVTDGNTPAFKVQLKSGFEELGTFYCGRILGFNFLTLKKSKYDNR
jgi:hypothetical protein